MSTLPWSIGVTQWTLGESTYERALARVAAAGYESVELFADPNGPRGARIERMLADAGLAAPSLCAMYSANRDCAHPDRTLRSRAAAYLRACLELGGELGVRALICVPTYRTQPLAAREDELRWAAETVRDALDEVAGGPTLVIEPLNRYETHLINTLTDAEALRAAIGDDRVAIMGDLFHMNIEEREISSALAAHAAHLAHVHLADSNRLQPGGGHLDFHTVGAELRKAGFTGTMSMEFFPATDDGLRTGLVYVQHSLAAAGTSYEGGFHSTRANAYNIGI